MKRALKGAASRLSRAPNSNHSIDATDTEHEPPPPALEPPADLPAPMSILGALLEIEHEGDKEATELEKMEAELDFRRWMLRKAEKNLKLFERRWEKKKKTYWEAGGKYSIYQEKSIVKRVETRLLEADEQLEAARVRMSMRRAEWLRARSCCVLFRRFNEDITNEQPMLGTFLDRAIERMYSPVPTPKGPFAVRRKQGTIWDFNATHYGLAMTWGLTHVDLLHGAERPQAEKDAANVAYAHESCRACIAKHLEKNKDPSTLGSGTWLLQWEKRGVDVLGILCREFHLCVCTEDESACETCTRVPFCQMGVKLEH